MYSGRRRAQSERHAAPTPTPAVVPILVYEDIEAAHDFLVGTFGLTSGGLHRLDDGTVVHGEVRNGDAPIWLHRVTAESEMDSPRHAAMSHGGLSVRIPDVDAHYARVQGGRRTDRAASPPTSPTACASTACGTSRTTGGGSPRRWCEALAPGAGARS